MIIHASPGPFLLAAKRVGADLPVYRKFITWAGLSHIDRTGTLDFGFPAKILDPIPEDGHTSKSFADICDEAALEIIAQDKPIDVAWSGGIDSTVALVALFKNGVDLDRLRIVMLPENPSTETYRERIGSVAEYPEFFDKYINGKIAYDVVKDVRDEISPDRLLVTGELGDQLFGSIRLFLRYQPYQIRKPYREVLDLDPTLVDIIEILEPFIAASPVPIETIFDLMWWLNFGLKWQSVSLRILGPDKFHLADNVFQFFRADDFQRWSFSNHDRKLQGCDVRSYKMPAKEYIYDFTHDADYRDNKLKVGSLPAGGYYVGFCCVLDDFSSVRFGSYSIEEWAFNDDVKDKFKELIQ
jgi:hypothetical protein